jgi:hypothetical protein
MSEVIDWLGYIRALTKALVANTTQNRTSFWIFACLCRLRPYFLPP